ncbi:MAG: hypothetical protein QF437_00880 [Planctomycetota bacterium]|nr:hypothetical protein [Planctomycetota bacterium]
MIPSCPYPPSYPLLLAGGGFLYCVRAHRRELLVSPLGKKGAVRQLEGCPEEWVSFVAAWAGLRAVYKLVATCSCEGWPSATNFKELLLNSGDSTRWARLVRSCL